jgi:putative glutamine amidotransferase
VDAERDRTEFTLLKTVLPQQKPVLGICRGFQLINTGLGGTLFEDIIEQTPQGMRHQYYPEFPRDMTPHEVNVSEDSRLAQIMDRAGAVPVNSLHHQGVQNLGLGLKPTAWAPDGIVEAFEQPEHPFLLAVQWHPEWLPEHDHMQAIFRSFVRAAAR